ncbi:MAG: amino acid ABC transporter permease [Parvibaculaceae bacterium]
MLNYALLLLEGASITVVAAALSTVLGLLGALLLLAARTSGSRALVMGCRIYVSFIRGTPALVLILFVYYALPALIGLDLPPLAAGVLALSANGAAFMSEVLRGSLARIPEGQWEGARALGLSRSRTWLFVIIPQLFANALPPLAGEFTMLVKGTALLSVITLVELTRRGQQIMVETYRPVETFLAVAAVYFLICFCVTSLTRWYEARIRERQGRRPA